MSKNIIATVAMATLIASSSIPCFTPVFQMDLVKPTQQSYLKTDKEKVDNFIKHVEDLRLEQERQQKIEEYKQSIQQERQRMDEIEKVKQLEYVKVQYNPYDLLQPSNLTYNKLYSVLKDTHLASITESLIQAEKQYGVNALFLVGLIANESSWGKSNRAKTQNNLTGFAVYSSYSRGGSFESKEDNILKTAKLLKEQYLSPKGNTYRGCDIWDVNYSYCMDGNSPDYNWSKTINSISYNVMNAINRNLNQ